MNKLQFPLLFSFPVMVLALLLSNFNRNAATVIPWLLGMNYNSQASAAMVHRAALELKQCVSNGKSLLSRSLCVNSWDDAKNQPSKQDVHLIILIHGWMGNPKEMDGIKESLMIQSKARMDQEKENNGSSSSDRVVVHSVTCNEGRTSDGIAAGGQRVAEEINQMVQEIWNHEQHQHHQPNIQLTIVGNSLGGLYGRYAVSEIDWTKDEDSQQQKARLIPHYFVTTATPHLGCGFQQTYLPLPRFMEHPIGNIMLRTGQDLFRLHAHGEKTDIIQEMTFSPTFIHPLSRFRKRIAYANAHGTDFQVPLPTAAFWAPTDSIHHTFVETEQESLVPRGVAMTLTTPKQEPIIAEPKKEVATAEELSKQLDRLGWTKVLIDVRHEMPINFNGDPPPSPTSSISSSDSEESFNTPKQQWTAKELLQEFDTGRLKSLPIGHMVMVANSKNEFYRNMCKSGIPIMDYLARDIINSI